MSTLAWKKKLHEEVEKIQTEHPDADVEVWSGAGDAPPPVKMSIGLGYTRSSRRIWVELGEQPIATVNWKREWLWLYAFVQPQTGQTYWWILKRSRRTEYSA